MGVAARTKPRFSYDRAWGQNRYRFDPGGVYGVGLESGKLDVIKINIGNGELMSSE